MDGEKNRPISLRVKEEKIMGKKPRWRVALLGALEGWDLGAPRGGRHRPGFCENFIKN